MAHPRRFLPSISLLAAFEAVVRTGGVGEAARDLALTQGTVSRLVMALEGQLGQLLFVRRNRRMVATDAARAYAAEVARALDIVARATVSLTSAPGAGVLNLAILPTFGTHWLAPRLPGFLKAHPGVTVNLTTRLGQVNFAADTIDAAIHFGRNDVAATGSVALAQERLIACVAPSLHQSLALRGPLDVPRAPHLSLDTRPGGWRGWYRHHGIAGAPPRGMVFDQFATMMQAAIHGLGVALLPDFLCADALAGGRLVALSAPEATGQGAYYLIWPETRAGWPPLDAFRAWIAEEVARGAAA